MGKEDKDKTGNACDSKGSLSIIGTGPGAAEHLTSKAKDALAQADLVIGYGRYIDLVAELVEGKEIIRSNMREEVDRAREAIELATKGRHVAMLSGGDAGIYGMAGLVLGLLYSDEYKEGASKVSLEVVPGLPAFSTAAALLGAPLMHDFASISLSDLLTPWELITKRIKAAATADFVIILYNPKSKSRTTQLGEAIDIIAKVRTGDTPVGIVKNASRDGEKVILTSIKKISTYFDDIDMSTILIIGNSQTTTRSGRMITPRGYKGVE